MTLSIASIAMFMSSPTMRYWSEEARENMAATSASNSIPRAKLSTSWSEITCTKKRKSNEE